MTSVRILALALSLSACSPSWYVKHGLSETELTSPSSVPTLQAIVRGERGATASESYEAALALSHARPEDIQPVYAELFNAYVTEGNEAIRYNGVLPSGGLEEVRQATRKVGVGAFSILAGHVTSSHLVRAWLAAVLLAELGPAAQPAVAQLIIATGHAHPDVRYHAVIALRSTQTPSSAVIAALRHLHETDENEGVRSEAKRSMRALEALAQQQAYEVPPAPPKTAVVALQQPIRRGTGDKDDRGLVSGARQARAWALIIGVEGYRDIAAPIGAKRDAEDFAAIARQTLGIPEQRIILALNERAGRGDVRKHVEWLRSNAEPGDRIYFFFSGHGSPDPTTGEAYLLPYDVDPNALAQTGLRLDETLASLADSRASEVIAFADSCFSGAGGRSVLPAGIRPLVPLVAPKAIAKVALISASSHAEISGTIPGGDRGLFTHHVVEGLGRGKADHDGDGQVSLRELHGWITPRVARDARRASRGQTPTLLTESKDDVILSSGLAVDGP